MPQLGNPENFGSNNWNRERLELRMKEEQYDISAELLLEEGEPEVCKKFGCGRTLSIRESLFGKYCIHHQQVK